MRDFLNKYGLLFVVFLTGGAILVLEVLATRMLSTYFGNTIFTVSSVISVILLALSCGYYIGGRLADKKASEHFFYKIILVSGYSVLLIYILNTLVVPAMSYSFGLREGPLIVSFFLFFLPSFLLGTLSPIVVVLQKKKVGGGVGRIAGDVFFWSTFGSIAGSLGSGFFLIPFFGIDKIILGIGILLIVIAVFGMAGKKINLFLIILLFMTFFLTPLVYSALKNFELSKNLSRNILFSKDGVYEKITIYDQESNGERIRYLQQDLDSSSAMFIDSSDHVFEYSKYYLLYKLSKEDIESALVIGAGAYTIPKSLLEDNSDIEVDVVEIEPELLEDVREYFYVPEDKRLSTIVEDGRRFLHDSEKKYDMIFSDAFNFSVPSHLVTLEFFELVKSRLNFEGVYIMNVVGSINDTSPSFAISEMKTFKQVFNNSYFFAVKSLENPRIQNIILVGFNTEKSISFDNSRFGGNQILDINNLKIIDLNKYDLARHEIFTDNYAPVDYYHSKTIR